MRRQRKDANARRKLQGDPESWIKSSALIDDGRKISGAVASEAREPRSTAESPQLAQCLGEHIPGTAATKLPIFAEDVPAWGGGGTAPRVGIADPQTPQPGVR